MTYTVNAESPDTNHITEVSHIEASLSEMMIWMNIH